jgi:hypothetical protein
VPRIALRTLPLGLGPSPAARRGLSLGRRASRPARGPAVAAELSGVQRRALRPARCGLALPHGRRRPWLARRLLRLAGARAGLWGWISAAVGARPGRRLAVPGGRWRGRVARRLGGTRGDGEAGYQREARRGAGEGSCQAPLEARRAGWARHFRPPPRTPVSEAACVSRPLRRRGRGRAAARDRATPAPAPAAARSRRAIRACI